jgi:hypothetical protein
LRSVELRGYSLAMAIERVGANEFVLSPGVMDPHGHPRVFDPITSDDFGVGNGAREGKAGVYAYTVEAFASGITRVHFMPNEQLRQFDPRSPELTSLTPYPISTSDRLLAVQSIAANQAVVPTGQSLGLDPTTCISGTGDRERLRVTELDYNFATAGADCFFLKVYGDETTGGFNVHPRYIPKIVERWHLSQPDKPVVLHLENENVGNVLRQINATPFGKKAPIHIAHVSSRQELQAVMDAKAAGMNVTCEVTLHHLFLTEAAREHIGGDAWMKPTLKPQADVDFIWGNIDSVDMIASDCAPHRRSDKLATKPAFGVTNYREMIPLLLGAVEQGKLTMERLYDLLCVAPRKRFDVPLEDGSQTVIATAGLTTARELTGDNPVFPNDPFVALERNGYGFQMVGRVVSATAGLSTIGADGHKEIRTSYTHQTTPQTIGHIAAYHANLRAA